MKKTLKIKKEKEEVGPQDPDFYMENGYVVFTSSYHLKRGYCCGSGCRHCPYKEREKMKT